MSDLHFGEGQEIVLLPGDYRRILCAESITLGDNECSIIHPHAHDGPHCIDMLYHHLMPGHSGPIYVVVFNTSENRIWTIKSGDVVVLAAKQHNLD